MKPRGFLTSNFPGQIHATIIDTSSKSILTCLYNNEKKSKKIFVPVKCSHVSTPSQPPSWGSVMGSSLYRVPPSQVHLHEGAPMCSVVVIFFIFEAKYLICFLVGAILLLSWGVPSFWYQVCFGPMLL